MKDKSKFRFGMFLVTIGIVYGDIGTSPMYVMKSILEGNGGITQINEAFIIGSLSLVIWTITLLTTVKYVLIAMKADNHGEGGIFSLFSLVRGCGKWLIVPAMLGGAALLADGVLTPAVTVTTAVEGLRSMEVMDRFLGTGQVKVVVITLIIITALFSVQHAGTSRIGKAFGPVMLLWFSFLGITGASHILALPVVLKAFNPIYAVRVLLSPANKLGFMILGSVFLATTGAEALYSDMGHVGKENIYFSWPFVKLCLILNYLGQGAWIIQSRGDTALWNVVDLNPFFLMLTPALRPFAVLLGAAAAVIASQALITGSYTLVSEAILLDLLPHLEIRYPSDIKGQLYIGTVNSMLWIGCSLVVLYFRSGARMESAYGLAITVTMLMTTLLLFVFLKDLKKKPIPAFLMLVVFGGIESIFFISSLSKFMHGGYVTGAAQRQRDPPADPQPRLSARRAGRGVHRPGYPLLHSGQGHQTGAGLLACQRQRSERAQDHDLQPGDLRHRQHLPHPAEPRLPVPAARQRLSAADRAGHAGPGRAAGAGEEVFDLRPLVGRHLQILHHPQIRHDEDRALDPG